MACGGCAERRERLITAAVAIASGDVATAAGAVKDVAASASRDLGRVARSARDVAAAKLSARSGMRG